MATFEDFLKGVDYSSDVLNDFAPLDALVPGYWVDGLGNPLTLQSEFNIKITEGFAFLAGSLGATQDHLGRTFAKTGVGTGFPVGTVIHHVAGSGSDSGGSPYSTYYTGTQGDSAAHAVAQYMVSQVNDADTVVLSPGGYITGLSGLTGGAYYYASTTTPGALTATKPTTSGECDDVIFIADGSTRGTFLPNYNPHIIP